MDEWISVKDKLPPERVDVLVWDNNFETIDVACWTPEGNKCEWNDFHNHWVADVTYWMPLPEKPKEYE